jgi:hypothetical protein
MNDIKIIDNLKTKKDYSVFDDERTKRKKADTYTGIVGKQQMKILLKLLL